MKNEKNLKAVADFSKVAEEKLGYSIGWVCGYCGHMSKTLEECDGHAWVCEESPLVARIRELETQVRRESNAAL